MSDDTIGVRDALVEARAKVDNAWAQGGYAFDEAGYSTEVNSYKAYAFCMLGAIESVMEGKDIADHEQEDPYNYAWMGAKKVDPTIHMRGWLDQFNDEKGRTKEDVLEAFDEAIKHYDSVNKPMGGN